MEALPNSINSLLREINVSSGIFATLLIVVGVVFLFAGIRFFKPIIASAGFLMFAYIGFSIMEAANAQEALGDKREWAYLLILAVIGVIGAGLALWIWKIGLFAIGAMGGYAVASFILACGINTSNGLIGDLGGRVAFIAIIMLIGAILAFVLERPTIIVGTALIGAHAVLYGVDIFAGTGYKNTASSFVNKKFRYDPSIENDKKVIGLLVSFAIIVLFGIAVQFKVTGKGLPTYSKR